MAWRTGYATKLGDGQWMVYVYDDGRGKAHVATAYGTTRGEAEERARVIASAKEMRAALERIVDGMHDRGVLWSRELEAADTVLALLRGLRCEEVE